MATQVSVERKDCVNTLRKDVFPMGLLLAMKILVLWKALFNERKKTFSKTTDIICQICLFIVIQYMLACFYLSFATNIFSIVLMVCNAGVIINFWMELSRTINSKVVKCVILFASIVVIGFILIVCGYFPVSTVLQDVPSWKRAWIDLLPLLCLS